MNTTEKNKLIAEFMELEATPKYNPEEYYVKEYNSGEWYLPEEMKYHKEWNWLMPVVNKCMQTGDNTDEWDALYDALSTVNRTNIHEAVVEFINQYNK